MDDFDFTSRTPEPSNRSLTSPGSDSSSLKTRLFDIQDLQAKVLEYQHENVILRREIDLKESKLVSCMRSIELFWSPELKKERKRRQEEESKLLKLIADFEKLKSQKEDSTTDSPSRFLSARLHGDVLSNKGGSDSPRKTDVRKTVEEMKTRLESQKATLAQREETIKKLLERLQEKTATMNALQEEMNRSLGSELTFKLEAAENEIASLNNQKAQWEYKLHKVEKQGKEMAENLRQKQLELEDARQRSLECSSHVASLQTAIEQKDIQISQTMQLAYERNAQYSEVRESQETMAQDRDEDRRQIEALQSHGKFLRAKIESLKQELALKEEKGHKELVLLQETVSAKAKQCERLQKNIQSMTEKLMAKDRKVGQMESLNQELVKERDRLTQKVESGGVQVVTLQRKVDGLETDMKEKEDLLMDRETRLSSLRSSQSEDDSSEIVRSLEEQLQDQSRHVKMLREQRARQDREREEENEAFVQTIRQLKAQAKQLNAQREEKEKKLAAAEEELLTMKEEYGKRNAELKVALSKRDTDVGNEDLHRKVHQLEKDARAKSTQVKELEKSLTDSTAKLTELRRAQKLERQMNAQLMGEVKRREGEETHREDRISQLKESLRESLEMAVERDKQIDSERARFVKSEEELAEVRERLSEMDARRNESEARLAKMSSELQDREALIVSLRAERQRQTEEVMDMKQNALLAEISERDANIALLETSSGRKEEHKAAIQALKTEKDRLVAELKDWTRKRLRLQHADDDVGESRLAKQLLDATPEQVFQAIRNMGEKMSCLRAYIDQLLAVVLEQNPGLLEGMPRQQQSRRKPVENLRGSPLKELLADLRDRERDNFNLQGYANLLLQRIMEGQPSILESVGGIQT